jgi:hypothetical protein
MHIMLKYVSAIGCEQIFICAYTEKDAFICKAILLHFHVSLLLSAVFLVYNFSCLRLFLRIVCFHIVAVFLI